MTYSTLADEAFRLGISVKTLRRRIASGDLPAYKVGRVIRVNPADVDALLRPIPNAKTAA